MRPGRRGLARVVEGEDFRNKQGGQGGQGGRGGRGGQGGHGGQLKRVGNPDFAGRLFRRVNVRKPLRELGDDLLAQVIQYAHRCEETRCEA